MHGYYAEMKIIIIKKGILYCLYIYGVSLLMCAIIKTEPTTILHNRNNNKMILFQSMSTLFNMKLKTKQKKENRTYIYCL